MSYTTTIKCKSELMLFIQRQLLEELEDDILDKVRRGLERYE